MLISFLAALVDGFDVVAEFIPPQCPSVKLTGYPGRRHTRK